MGMVEVEILLCVPEGDELSEDRLEVLADLGFSTDEVVRRRAGRLAVLFLAMSDTWESDAESKAEEILEELTDANLIDISQCE